MALWMFACVEVSLRPLEAPPDPALDWPGEPPEQVWCGRRVEPQITADLASSGPEWATYEARWHADYAFVCYLPDLELGRAVCPTTLDGIDGPHTVLCLTEGP
ncbi:MAG: hypothetical protein AAF602_23000 [Myxococcota bacterium]